jgi:hypothetical protein
MSILAGSIIHAAGRTVINRIQAAGLGAVNIPIDTVHEVGNMFIVDKIVQEPEFTFTMESLDVSTELEALLHGEVSSSTASAAAQGELDAGGKSYDWSEIQPINIISPWKNPATGSAGTVEAGHLLPSYFPKKITYKFGVKADAMQTVELDGGAFYYGAFAPFEDFYAGNGATKEFVTTNPAVHTRIGGVLGSTFQSVFGVLVNGTYMVEGEDYEITGGGTAAEKAVATITFTEAPANGAVIRVAYFTTAAQAYPQPVHANTVVIPGAVRGRNIVVSIAPLNSDAWVRLPRVQEVKLEGTYDAPIERELGDTDPVGRTINSFDTNGDMIIRAENRASFFNLLKLMTGLNTQEEVVGYINQNPIRLKIEIQNPRNPGEILKTLFVPDAIFDIPGTPARANTPTDFTLTFKAQTGDHTVFKGAFPL